MPCWLLSQKINEYFQSQTEKVNISSFLFFEDRSLLNLVRAYLIHVSPRHSGTFCQSYIWLLIMCNSARTYYWKYRLGTYHNLRIHENISNKMHVKITLFKNPQNFHTAKRDSSTYKFAFIISEKFNHIQDSNKNKKIV